MIFQQLFTGTLLLVLVVAGIRCMLGRPVGSLLTGVVLVGVFGPVAMASLRALLSLPGTGVTLGLVLAALVFLFIAGFLSERAPRRGAPREERAKAPERLASPTAQGGDDDLG